MTGSLGWFGALGAFGALPVRPIAVGVVLAGFTVLVYFLFRTASGGKPEPLPANIKPYLTDDDLEGRKVVQVGWLGLLSAVLLSVFLAGYWIFLPKMQADAADRFRKESIDRGRSLFDITEKGGQNCAGCHGGGLGGKVDYVITTGLDQGKKVSWECPSLNDVYFRYTRDEVKQILIYGRPGTPMPPWGLDGNGPLNDQQLEDLLNYMKSIEIPRDEAIAAAGFEGGNKILDGRKLFLKNCARCHTPSFSYTAPEERDSLEQGIGAYGPNLRNERSQFPDIKDQIDFIKEGSVANAPYGVRGIGNGRMPGFGRDPDHPLLDDLQIRAIAEYERSLRGPLDPSARASGAAAPKELTPTPAATQPPAPPTSAATTAPTTTLPNPASPPAPTAAPQPEATTTP